MISRLARGRRSATRLIHYAVPSTRIVASGLRESARKPVVLLVPGRLL